MENVKVKDRFTDKKTGIEYIKQGDYYLPNLVLAQEETNYTIGKYGRMKLNYLKNHKKAEYIIMFMNCTLRKHIVDTDKQAKERFEILMKQMLEKNLVDENLKNTDTIKWVGLMNNYKHSVEEIIFEELIYIYNF